MKYDLVITGGGQGKADWEIHKHGCADIERMRRCHAYNACNTVEATDPVALIKRELDDELRDMGYTASDFKVMPCVKAAVKPLVLPF